MLKKDNFLSASFSTLKKKIWSNGGDVEMTNFENPMQDQGVNDSSKKQRRLSSRELMSEMASQHRTLGQFDFYYLGTILQSAMV